MEEMQKAKELMGQVLAATSNLTNFFRELEKTVETLSLKKESVSRETERMRNELSINVTNFENQKQEFEAYKRAELLKISEQKSGLETQKNILDKQAEELRKNVTSTEREHVAAQNAKNAAQELQRQLEEKIERLNQAISKV